MTSVTSATQSDSTNTSPLTNSQESAATTNTDYQNFLKLLTEQMKNQDPLHPLDSADFVAQLATFSSVEQQIQTNSLLENLVSQLSVSGLEGATQWIGKEIEIESGAAQYQGEPLDYIVPGEAQGVDAEVVVSNLNGDVVYSHKLSAAETTFTWDGSTDDGDAAPVGNYVVSINIPNEDGSTDSVSPISTTKVREARMVDSEVKLVLENGALANPSDILAVRTTDGETDDAS